MGGERAAEILADAKRAAGLGQVRLTRHAEQRMDERCITVGDVLSALKSARQARYQPDRGTWKLTGGKDIDGDDTDVVIEMPNPNVVVVSVF